MMASDLSYRIRNMTIEDFEPLLARVLDENPNYFAYHLDYMFHRRGELRREAGDEIGAVRDERAGLVFRHVRGAVEKEEGFAVTCYSGGDPLSPWRELPVGAFVEYADEARNPSAHVLVRAHYWRALWELRRVWGSMEGRETIGTPVEVARQATSAHVDAAVWMLDQKLENDLQAMYAVEHWRAAVHLAALIGEPTLLEPALPKMRDAIARLVLTAGPWAISLIQCELALVYVRGKRTALIPNARLEELLGAVDTIRDEIVRAKLDHHEASAIDAHIAIERLLDRAPDAKEVAKRYAEMLSAQAGRAKTHFHAAHLWKMAAVQFRQAGMSAECGTALERSRDSVGQAQTEVKSHFIPINVTDQEREKMLAYFFNGATAASQVLGRLATRLFATSLEGHSPGTDRSGFIAHLLFATQPVVGDRLGAPLGAGTPEQAAHLDSQDLVMEVQLGTSLVISPTLQRLREEWDLHVDDLLAIVGASEFATPEDMPFLRTAFDRYLAGDFISAIHVLVPRTEQLVRRALRAVHVNITTERSGELREKPFGELLRSAEEAGALPEQIIRLLQATLSEAWGLNLRNEVAHGLITPERCDQSTADRLIHIAVLVASFGVG